MKKVLQFVDKHYLQIKIIFIVVFVGCFFLPFYLLRSINDLNGTNSHFWFLFNLINEISFTSLFNFVPIAWFALFIILCGVIFFITIYKSMAKQSFRFDVVATILAIIFSVVCALFIPIKYAYLYGNTKIYLFIPNIGFFILCIASLCFCLCAIFKFHVEKNQ